MHHTTGRPDQERKHWNQGGHDKSSRAAWTLSGRQKRGRLDTVHPAPSGSSNTSSVFGGGALEVPRVGSVAMYPQSNPPPQPARDEQLPGGSSSPRWAEKGETRDKDAPNRTTEHREIGDNEGRNGENAERNPTTEQTQQQSPQPHIVDSGCSHAALQELLRRIIKIEFSDRCSQRSMAIVEVVCDTLCQKPVAVVKVMEVLDECFADAVKTKQQQQLLNYWYIVDAVMKLYRDRPPMLNAVVVALPHLLLRYVPWKKSKLGEEPWTQIEKNAPRYEHLFNTWGHAVPKELLDEIWSLWRHGAAPTDLPSSNGVHRER